MRWIDFILYLVSCSWLASLLGWLVDPIQFNSIQFNSIQFNSIQFNHSNSNSISKNRTVDRRWINKVDALVIPNKQKTLLYQLPSSQIVKRIGRKQR